MKKLFYVLIALLFSFTIEAQNDVTKFLGFPVDGKKSKMIKNLKSKGFIEQKFPSGEILHGVFNGTLVDIIIMTENGKVFGIGISDAYTIGAEDIKYRFNKLCEQFIGNGKYVTFKNYIIPEDEDISYEMNIDDKKYTAIFYQLPEESTYADFIKDYKSKYTKEQLKNPSKEILADISSSLMSTSFEASMKKPVVFSIDKCEDGYKIIMYYVNKYNRANGEDL